MENSIILRHLNEFIKKKKSAELSKKEVLLFTELEEISAEDIYLGETPKYFFAYMNCNSTGVGESSFKGTETQRTVSKDYVTDEYLFIDGHYGAGKKGLSLFYLKPGETISNYYSKDDMVKLSKECGFQLHLQSFRDLNFRLVDHRLNRYNVNITKGPFTYNIFPVYARTPKFAQLLIGYTYELNGNEYIIIEPEQPQKENKLKEKTGCAPWMFLGLIFPPILFVAAFVLYVNYKKTKWRG